MIKTRFIYQGLALIFVMGLFNACIYQTYIKPFDPSDTTIKDVTLNTCLTLKFKNNLDLKNLKTLTKKYLKKHKIKVCKKPNFAVLKVVSDIEDETCTEKYNIDYTNIKYGNTTITPHQECLGGGKKIYFDIGNYRSTKYDLNWKVEHNNVIDSMIQKLKNSIEDKKLKIFEYH